MVIRLRQINLAYGNPPLLDDAEIALGVGERAAVGAANRAFGAAPNPDFIGLYWYPEGISVAGTGTYARMDRAHAKLPAGIRLALLAEGPFEYIQTAGTEALVEAKPLVGAGESSTVGRAHVGAPLHLAMDQPSLLQAPDALRGGRE